MFEYFYDNGDRGFMGSLAPRGAQTGHSAHLYSTALHVKQTVLHVSPVHDSLIMPQSIDMWAIDEQLWASF